MSIISCAALFCFYLMFFCICIFFFCINVHLRFFCLNLQFLHFVFVFVLHFNCVSVACFFAFSCVFLLHHSVVFFGCILFQGSSTLGISDMLMVCANAPGFFRVPEISEE